jgi:hypothetical protein
MQMLNVVNEIEFTMTMTARHDVKSIKPLETSFAFYWKSKFNYVDNIPIQYRF